MLAVISSLPNRAEGIYSASNWHLVTVTFVPTAQLRSDETVEASSGTLFLS